MPDNIFDDIKDWMGEGLPTAAVPLTVVMEQLGFFNESDKERNPFKTFGKTVKTTFKHIMPGGLAAGGSAMMPNQLMIPPSVGTFGAASIRKQIEDNTGKEYFEQQEAVHHDMRKDLLQFAIDQSQKAGKELEDLVTRTSDIKDPIDMLNYAAYATGQMLPQSAAAIVPGVGQFSAIGQEVGEIYMQEVLKIAEAKGITPEEVIDKGLDDRATAIAFGTVAGLAEKLGATKVMKGMRMDSVMDAVRKRGKDEVAGMTTNKVKKFLKGRMGRALTGAVTEGATEGIQSIIEQAGASIGADQDVNIDWEDVKESFAAGFVGARTATTIAQTTDLIVDALVNKKEAPQTEIQPVFEKGNQELNLQSEGMIRSNVDYDQLENLIDLAKSGDYNAFAEAAPFENVEDGYIAYNSKTKEELIEEFYPALLSVDNPQIKPVGDVLSAIDDITELTPSNDMIASLKAGETDFRGSFASVIDSFVNDGPASDLPNQVAHVVNQMDGGPAAQLSLNLINTSLQKRKEQDPDGAPFYDKAIEVLKDKNREVKKDHEISKLQAEGKVIPDEMKRDNLFEGEEIRESEVDQYFDESSQPLEMEREVAVNKMWDYEDTPINKAAKKTIEKKLTEGKTDEEIVSLIENELGVDPFTARDMFEKTAQRPYKPPNNYEVSKRDNNLKDNLLWLRFKLADKYAYVDNLQKQAEKALGIKLGDDLAAKEKLELARGKAHHNKTNLIDSLFKGKDAYIKRLKKAKISWDELNKFGIALHAPERQARIEEMHKQRIGHLKRELAKIYNDGGSKRKARKLEQLLLQEKEKLATIQEGGRAGRMTSQEANNFIQELKDSGRYDSFKEMYDEIYDNVVRKYVDVLEEGGLLDPNRAEYLRTGKKKGYRSKFDYYLPLIIKDEAFEAEFGVDPNTVAAINQTMSAGLKSLKGTTKFNVDDTETPLNVAIARLLGAYDMVEQNAGKKSLANLIKEYPNTNRYKIVKAQMVPVENEMGEIERVNNFTPQHVVDNSITYRDDDGKLNYIHFLDPNDGILQAFQSTNIDNAITRMLNGPAWRGVMSAYRLAVTSLNPSFILSNFSRDVQEVMSNLPAENIKGARRSFIKNLPVATSYLLSNESIMKKSKMRDYWLEMQRNGVPMSFSRNYDMKEQMVDLQRNIDKIEGHLALGEQGKDAAMKALKKIAQPLLYLSDQIENSSRLATYATMRDLGASEQKAAFAAKGVTINFERKGKSKTLNNYVSPLYLFLSVAINGADKTINLLKSKAGLKGLATLTGLYALNRILLHALTPEDELEDYLNSEYIRGGSTLVYNPFDPKNPIRIPKTYSILRLFSSMSESLVDSAMGYKSPVDVLLERGPELMTVFDVFGGSTASYTNMLPGTPFQPIYQGVANQNFAGQKILWSESRGKPNHLTYDKKTKEPFINAGKAIYDNTGRSIDISPTILEHVFNGYAKLGVLRQIDEIPKAMESFDEGEITQGVFKLPILNKFYKPLDDDQKAVLYNFFDMVEKQEVKGRLTDKQMTYFIEGAAIIEALGLARKSTVNNQVENMIKRYPENNWKGVRDMIDRAKIKTRIKLGLDAQKKAAKKN